MEFSSLILSRVCVENWKSLDNRKHLAYSFMRSLSVTRNGLVAATRPVSGLSCDSLTIQLGRDIADMKMIKLL